MVLTRVSWRYGGHQVLLYCSFWGWTKHYPMTLMEGSATVFLATFDLPPGMHQYRFLVDGIWRFDERELCIAGDHGVVNNVLFTAEPGVPLLIPQSDSGGPSMDLDGVSPHMNQVHSYMTPEAMAPLSAAEIQASCSWVSGVLSNRTIYDILPVSGKISVMDAQLPVKQAFHIMYEEGLAVVPIWDDFRANITGMLTASDFILILRELQKSARIVANEELEIHTVSAWKEGKSQLYTESNGPVGLSLRPLIHVSDHECLKDVALKIVRNEISAVPIFKFSLQDASSMPLLNLACLPGILKYICSHLGEVIGSMPFLRHPICRVPLGTWSPETGRGRGRDLVIMRLNDSLSSALELLLTARISSIPIVNDDGLLIDVYSRSDIIALAKDDMYARIQLDQMTMDRALEQVYQAYPHPNGRRPCHTCVLSTSFHEVIEKLCDPGVRRLIVIDPRSRRVEGIISLRDVLNFFLGDVL